MFAIHLHFPDTGNQYFLGRGSNLVEAERAQLWEDHNDALAIMATLPGRVWTIRGLPCTTPVITLKMV